MVREMLRAILTKLGHEAVCVADGTAALGAPPCALVFLDLELPGASGLEVAAAMRARGADVPIIALTGHGDAAHRRLAAEAGIDRLLAKPFAPGDIAAAIGRAFGIDMEAARNALNRREDLLRSMVADIVAELPDLLAAARDANDTAGLRRAAHTIRGCLRFLDAPEAARLAADLEEAAAAGRREEGLLRELEGSLTRLIPRLAAFLRS